MVLNLLTDSAEFFERRATDPQLLPAALIVLVVGAANALGSISSLQATLSLLPQSIGDVGPIIQAVVAVFVLVISFIQWLLYTLLFFATAKLFFDGSGSFRTTAALVGWGFAPLFISAVVNAAIVIYVYAGVTFPSDPTQVQQIITNLQSSPLLLIGSLVGIACLLWSGYLWMLAIQYSQELPRRSALISVAVPVLTTLLLRIPGLL